MNKNYKFMKGLIKETLGRPMTSNEHEKYGVSSTIISSYSSRKNSNSIGDDCADFLRLISLDEIKNKPFKKDKLISFLENYLTESEKIYAREHNNDLYIMLTFAISKYIDSSYQSFRIKVEESNKSLSEIEYEKDLELRKNKYLKNLKKKINQDSLTRFINLKLCEEVSYSNLKFRKIPDKVFSIRDIVSSFSNRVALLAEPGAGKTTLLKELTNICIDKKDIVPVFIRMGFYRKNSNLNSLIVISELKNHEKEKLLEDGKLLILLDGINEVPDKNINDVIYEIVEFINKYPKNKYILSCRIIEFPVWALNEFEEVSVLPIPIEEIENQFKYILGSKGIEFYNEFSKKNKYKELRELFHNPLLLGMIISICRNHEEDNLINIKSKANLYKKFINKFSYHQQKKSSNYIYSDYNSIEEFFMCYIAYNMQNRNCVFISEFLLKEIIFDFIENEDDILRRKISKDKISVLYLFKYIVTRPQLDICKVDDDEPLQYSFIHQSFQEYYAALYISKYIEDSFSYNDLEKYIIDKSRRHWEFISFVSSLIEPKDEFLNYLKSVAKKYNDQSLLTLCANCIMNMDDIDKTLASDLCIRMLDAFKYWNIPFDYDLIYRLKELVYNVNGNFPKRLIEDIKWFESKYVQTTEAMTLNNIKSINILLDYANSDNYILAIDSIKTLGIYKNYNTKSKREVVKFLLDKIDKVDGEFKEYIIIALKDLADSESVNKLIEIIKSKKETIKVKVNALNALGNIGHLESTYSVIEYLKNLENECRDSAAWALQYIGQVAKDKDNNLFEFIKKILISCLLNESNDKQGKYSKGTILYSLGKLCAVEYGDEILEWIKNQSDEYVIEDAINTIGNLNLKKGIKILEKFLNHSDPVIKVKSIEALIKLEYNFSIEQIMKVKKDNFEYVSDWGSEMEKYKKL